MKCPKCGGESYPLGFMSKHNSVDIIVMDDNPKKIELHFCERCSGVFGFKNKEAIK